MKEVHIDILEGYMVLKSINGSFTLQISFHVLEI